MTWSDELSQKMDAALRRLAAREARARLERELQRSAQVLKDSIYAKRGGLPETVAASAPTRSH